MCLTTGIFGNLLAAVILKKMTHTHAAVYQKPLRFFFPHTPLTGTYDHFHFKKY